jgi:hypothetical protein
MIFSTIFSLYHSVYISFPVSWSWGRSSRASMRRLDYFNVAESWEGHFLYTGDDVTSLPFEKR